MYFKNPEILYFLFLLLVPILVHLFQLRRFKKEFFTNVRFLKELSLQTRKSSKLKKWLLLSCRLLLLTMIVFAFAQPYFLTNDRVKSKSELYIILDNSYSMQAKGKKGELLKRAVQELLETIPENTPFSLITNTSSFWNTDLKEVKSALQNLKYSALPFQLETQINKINAHKSAFNKDIVVITDGLGMNPKQLENRNKKENLYFVISKAEQKNNIAIDSVSIQETVENFYKINVELSQYGQNEQSVPIAIYDQDKLIAKTAISFESSTKKILFTIPKKEFNGYVSISDNSLSYDNKLFFTISKTKKIKVTSIGELQKSEFLSRIYTKNDFEFSAVPLPSLDYNSIENQDVIILNELDVIPQALQTTLKAFVINGGNLILIPSLNTLIPEINTFLKQLGSIQFQKLDSTEKLMTSINFGHPLFAGIFESKIKNFQYPFSKSSFAIGGSAASILSNQDKTAFLSSLRKPLSSVYIFNSALNSINSNFQQSPLIVPVFYQMAMNTNNNGIIALTIGNTNPFIVDAQLSKDAILEVKSKTEQFIPIQQIVNKKVKLLFNDYPEEAGNFIIYNQNNSEGNISFNYKRTESDLTASSETILKDVNVIESIASVFDKIHSDSTDSQIWKWFVIFALVFLVIEMALIRFLK
jgi:hypothetical protein